MTRLVAWLVAVATFLGACPAAGAGVPRTKFRFLAGAAVIDSTPPLAGTPAGRQADRQFASGFATCSSTAYASAGRFALQEPFSDLNHDGQWDAGFDLTGGPNGRASDPYCDANGNGRWDGIYADNGRGPATAVHDPIEVRAFAVSDGVHMPVVYASAAQIGIFDYYTEQARAELANTYHVHAALVVSANHNESSPDSIGLYGAVQTPVGVGARSGIDEYFMAFLDDRIARAAALAVQNLRPARLYANQVEGALAAGASGESYPLLTGLSQRISDQFPTSVSLPGDRRIAAVDTKLGVLQARTQRGRPIFTAIELAAHNQEMGNAGTGMSSDWPGALERYFDAHQGGTAVFLAGDNGSEEDPQTNPPVIPKGSENHSNQATQYIQAAATGVQLARVAARAAQHAVQLQAGPVTLTREQFCVPVENNGFVALAAGGEFGRRQAYVCDGTGTPITPVPNGSVAPTSGTQFRTFVSFADIGPDLQLIDNPGEAFPALMLGSPFGVQDQSCPRPNPAVPTWHARGLFRFQVGLADDLIGYLIPAWGFASGTPGLFSNDNCYQDMHGHGHKLESESAGPTSANDVADRLAGLLGREPDPSAHIIQGRFITPGGTYSRWATGAVGAMLLGGQLIAPPGTRAFGSRRVTLRGLFMDYDGQPQRRPDITTRGMIVLDHRGCVAARYYIDVFEDLSRMPALGRPKRAGRRSPRPPACRFLSLHGVPELQPGAAAAAGLRTVRAH